MAGVMRLQKGCSQLAATLSGNSSVFYDEEMEEREERKKRGRNGLGKRQSGRKGIILDAPWPDITWRASWY